MKFLEDSEHYFNKFDIHVDRWILISGYDWCLNHTKQRTEDHADQILREAWQ